MKINKLNRLLKFLRTNTQVSYSPKKEIKEIASTIFYQEQNTRLKKGHLNKAHEAFLCYTYYKELFPKTPSDKFTGAVSGNQFDVHEGILSDALVLATKKNDDFILDKVVELMPEQVSDVRLYFNLACIFSIKQQKESMISYMKMSLNLGKSPDDFLRDTDFQFYYDDTDFRNLLKKY